MRWLQSLYRKRFEQVMATRSLTDLSQSAIVFAPHPDDETLGCGGTILRKKAAGAAVKLVFVTDGSRSHASLMAEAELREIREREALAAAAALGIADTDVTFLGFGDGRLAENLAAATEKISEFLQANPAAEIFIPSHLETPPDHALTGQAVLTALAQLSLMPEVYAYPIWYWHQWPWVPLRTGGGKRKLLEQLKAIVTNKLGTTLFRDFQHAVYIQPVLDQKRTALDQHASQMRKPEAIPQWPTLGEVGQGDFLECFFQNYEIFHSPPKLDLFKSGLSKSAKLMPTQQKT